MSEMLVETRLARANTPSSRYLPVLAKGVKIFPLGISMEPLKISPLDFISRGLNIFGSSAAPTPSIRAMLEFAAKHNIKPQIEKFPLTQAGITEAMQKLRDGKMRYRGVLVAGK